jgi:hypothetical protein
MDITDTPVKISNGGGVALQVVGAGTVFVGQDAADPTVEGLSLASTAGVVYLQDTHGKLFAATATGTVDLRVLSL